MCSTKILLISLDKLICVDTYIVMKYKDVQVLFTSYNLLFQKVMVIFRFYSR